MHRRGRRISPCGSRAACRSTSQPERCRPRSRAKRMPVRAAFVRRLRQPCSLTAFLSHRPEILAHARPFPRPSPLPRPSLLCRRVAAAAAAVAAGVVRRRGGAGRRGHQMSRRRPHPVSVRAMPARPCRDHDRPGGTLSVLGKSPAQRAQGGGLRRSASASSGRNRHGWRSKAATGAGGAKAPRSLPAPRAAPA